MVVPPGGVGDRGGGTPLFGKAHATQDCSHGVEPSTTHKNTFALTTNYHMSKFNDVELIKIECKTCTVYLQPFIKRKHQRAYNSDLFTDAQTDPSTGKTRLKLTNVDLAAENLALKVIEKVAPKAGEQDSFKPTREWLDDLPETDWKLIDDKLKELRGEKDDEDEKSPKE